VVFCRVLSPLTGVINYSSFIKHSVAHRTGLAEENGGQQQVACDDISTAERTVYHSPTNVVVMSPLVT